MGDTRNKKHWYDGWFYARFIDPWEDEIMRIVAEFIPDGASVVDIGSGTGALVFRLAPRCRRVVGVELSKKMVQYAESKKDSGAGTSANVRFVHADGRNLADALDEHFDYATVCHVLHEMNPEERLPLIKEARRIATNVIVADYGAPQLQSMDTFLRSAAEFFAGWHHFTNHRSFIAAGGAEALLEQSGLNIQKVRLDHTRAYKIILAR